MRNNPQNPKETEVQDFPRGRILHAHNLFCLVKNKTLVTSFPPVKSMTFNFPSLSSSSPSPRQIKAGGINLLPRCFDHRRATYVHTFLDIFRYLQAPKFELLFCSTLCDRCESLLPEHQRQGCGDRAWHREPGRASALSHTPRSCAEQSLQAVACRF